MHNEMTTEFITVNQKIEAQSEDLKKVRIDLSTDLINAMELVSSSTSSTLSQI